MTVKESRLLQDIKTACLVAINRDLETSVLEIKRISKLIHDFLPDADTKPVRDNLRRAREWIVSAQNKISGLGDDV